MTRGSSSTSLNLIGVWAPIGLAVIGLVLLVWALVLGRRRTPARRAARPRCQVRSGPPRCRSDRTPPRRGLTFPRAPGCVFPRGDGEVSAPSGTLLPTMTATAPPLLDDPADLSALRAKGADPDELFASFAAWAEAQRHGAVPGAGGGADRAGQRRERRPGDADRLGQVAGGHRRAVRGARGRTAQLLHRADQGAGQREVLRAVRGVRRGQRRHAHRRRGGERTTPRSSPAPPRCWPTSRCARARGRRHRPRGHGRVPLLRRPRPRLGLAGAAAGAAEGAVPADDAPRSATSRSCARTSPAAPAGRRRWSPTPSARCRCTTTTRRRRCTRRSRICWTPSRRRSTSSTSPRPRRWSGPRR